MLCVIPLPSTSGTVPYPSIVADLHLIGNDSCQAAFNIFTFGETMQTAATNNWMTWNNTPVTSTAPAIWQAWVTTSNTQIIVQAAQGQVWRPGPPTAEQQAIWTRERAAVAAARDAAINKAETLLLAHLTQRQRQDYKRARAFFVKGSSGIRYRIRHGRVGNVDVIDAEGRVTARLCAHPHADVPDADTLLAQKLMLETDDLEFTRIANRTVIAGTEQLLEALH